MQLAVHILIKYMAKKLYHVDKHPLTQTLQVLCFIMLQRRSTNHNFTPHTHTHTDQQINRRTQIRPNPQTNPYTQQYNWIVANWFDQEQQCIFSLNLKLPQCVNHVTGQSTTPQSPVQGHQKHHREGQSSPRWFVAEAEAQPAAVAAELLATRMQILGACCLYQHFIPQNNSLGCHVTRFYSLVHHVIDASRVVGLGSSSRGAQPANVQKEKQSL